jgi:hypothetical protein
VRFSSSYSVHTSHRITQNSQRNLTQPCRASLSKARRGKDFSADSSEGEVRPAVRMTVRGSQSWTPPALCRETLSAVPPWGNHQDRTASPPQWLRFPSIAFAQRQSLPGGVSPRRALPLRGYPRTRRALPT